ncbi:ergothioneine biosynthesis protein EgtB [Psychroflexus montanilacus]|uniref:ergothioneine biosynthesis protein EgtB n=1 Tax=Psychroflexus montanilacus TaxID=2873598 RepID=UPI001CCB475F|nr:ergothioneine biosynthesis protein EgtB [Psychroflexus montanilacus]MBZ9651989.1 ergothioneine biosynthesis protein EgtB [Psychroflexus montanilacus]
MIQEFIETRAYSEKLCEPLETEDFVIQPVEFVSPVKWHLAHTTWFFEVFILTKFKNNYSLYNEDFPYLFNSYYEAKGERVVRANRGNLSRPTVDQIFEYRTHVTKALKELLETNSAKKELLPLVEIGIHHEKQHQELLLMDIKYCFGHNPLLPVYNSDLDERSTQKIDPDWVKIPEGLYEIGHKGDGFSYDNETKAHKVFLQSFEIKSCLVTNGDFLEFMEQGGYENPLLWHAEAWDWIQEEKIGHPLYWQKTNEGWKEFHLSGLKMLDKSHILSHVSYFEAAAFAQWKGCRLPTEFEWEVAQQHFEWGKRWECTESAYSPYPNYQKAAGALGEYNGKFMVNQKVFRGGSGLTSKKHTRKTYRNFFHPHMRWQQSGVRLAK